MQGFNSELNKRNVWLIRVLHQILQESDNKIYLHFQIKEFLVTDKEI